MAETCTPDDQNVYGPYDQTIFLGCSVMGFTATAGWNGQSSSLSIQLVEDKCAGPRSYTSVGSLGGIIFNENVAVDNLPSNLANGDPGFTNPILGAPAYFRVGEFEYAGLIQSYTQKEGTGGNTYDVTLVDPRVILDNTQVILDIYDGDIFNLYNVFNVYGFLEDVGSAVETRKCAATTSTDAENTVMLGSLAGGLGGSRRTERGIPWNLIKVALQNLAGNYNWGPSAGLYGSQNKYGRGAVCYKQGSPRGFGELQPQSHNSPNAARYILDISELPNSYTWDYRIAGPTVSISDLINQVCADAGMDYYIELLPTKKEGGGGIALVIKVRTIKRTNQQSLVTVLSNTQDMTIPGGVEGVDLIPGAVLINPGEGQYVEWTGTEIEKFILMKKLAPRDQFYQRRGEFVQGQTRDPKIGVTQSSVGKELRTDVNSTLLIGAKVKQIYEQSSTWIDKTEEDDTQCSNGELTFGNRKLLGGGDYDIGNNDNFTPFWGFDSDGNVHESFNTGSRTNQWDILLDFREINQSLFYPISDDFLYKNSHGQTGFGIVREIELRWALGFDLDLFMSKIITEKYDRMRMNNPPGQLGFTVGQSTIRNYYVNILKADMSHRKEFGFWGHGPINSPVGVPFGLTGSDLSTAHTKDAITIHEWLKSYASEYYGKQFLVRMPDICQVNPDSETLTILTTKQTPILEKIWSDVPSTDGGWATKGTIAETIDGSTYLKDIEDAPTVLGLSTSAGDYSETRIDRFQDDVGKLFPILKFEGTGNDISAIPKESLLMGVETKEQEIVVWDPDAEGAVGNWATKDVVSSEIWVKAEIHDKWIEQWPVRKVDVDETEVEIKNIQQRDNDTPFITYKWVGIIDYYFEAGGCDEKPVYKNQVSALLTLPAPIYDKSSMPVSEHAAWGIVYDDLNRDCYGDIIIPSGSIVPGGPTLTAGGMGSACRLPVSAAIPIQSNKICYGPWALDGLSVEGDPKPGLRVAGTVRCEVDEGLAPWEYGGIKYMQEAATAKITNAITAMQVGEKGEVTIPGYPTLGLGGALVSTTPSIAKYDTRIVQAASNSTYGDSKFQYHYIDAEGGPSSAGASISSINVNVSTQGVTTSYSMATFSPVFGRFSKDNAERVKQVGLNKLSGERESRAKLRARGKLAASSAKSSMYTNIPKSRSKVYSPGSPAVFLAGKSLENPDTNSARELPNNYRDGTRGRKIVTAPDMHTLSRYEDYDNTAIVTLDALFRPVNRYAFCDATKGSPPIDNFCGCRQNDLTISEYRGVKMIGNRVQHDVGMGGLPEDTHWTARKKAEWADADGGTNHPLYPRPYGGENLPRNAWRHRFTVNAPGAGLTIDIDRQPTQTMAPPPPLSNYTGLPIIGQFLDFLADPVSNSGFVMSMTATGMLARRSVHGADKSKSPYINEEEGVYDPPYDKWQNATMSPPYPYASGHDIEGVARSGINELYEGSSSGSLLLRGTGVDSLPSKPTFAQNYRYMALRGPLVVHGWGYDVFGKPIPNEMDQAHYEMECKDSLLGKALPVGAEHGEFQTEYQNCSDNFYPNWLENSKSWPVAPVDLRFDRKRGVWTIPPSFRMYQVGATGVIMPGDYGIANVIKVKDDITPQYEWDENSESNKKLDNYLELENWTDVPLCGKTLAYFDSAENKYWAIATEPFTGIKVLSSICRAKGCDGSFVDGSFWNNDTYIGKKVVKDGQCTQTVLGFGCGLTMTVIGKWDEATEEGHEGDDGFNEDAGTQGVPAGSLFVGGLRVGFENCPDGDCGLAANALAPASVLRFDGFKMTNAGGDPGNNGDDNSGCEWTVIAPTDGGQGCVNAISADIPIVTDVVCVGAAFQVKQETAGFVSGCLVSWTNQDDITT